MTIDPPQSRRALLASGGALAAAGLLAACGGKDEAPSPAHTGSGSRDVSLLNRALDLEHAAVAAYTAGAPLVGAGAARRRVTAILDQEHEHVRGLREAVTDLGGTPHRPMGAAEYDRRLGLPQIDDQAALLTLAARLENQAVAAYLAALPELSSGELRQTVSAIVANEAEHMAILAGMRRPGSLDAQSPAAFVVGRA